MTGGKFFKQTVHDVPLAGKTVLVRADYNVPLEKNGQIGDDFRILSSLPTLQYLLDQRCKVVVMSHLGRPKGKDVSCSLEVVAKRLRELLEVPVAFVDDCKGDKVRMAVKKAPARSVILLENLRFYSEEEANDDNFARAIAKDSQAQYFVQDGFGVVHRAHASTDAITHWLPSVAGLLLEKEYTTITSAMQHPKAPLVAVLGGAKVSDKLPLVKALIPLADQMVIGGAMANTFLAAKGVNVGKSKYEPGQEVEIAQIYEQAKKKSKADGDMIHLPVDVAVATTVDEKAQRRTVSVENIGPDDLALDIGEKAIDAFVKVIESAATVIWNGTMGLAELTQFSHGSARIALALATHPNIVSVIGGGDTADFALHWDSKKGGSFTHVSTGGGASLELMSGKKLPGVEALLDRAK